MPSPQAACRAATQPLHLYQSFAMTEMLLKVFPICCISFSAVRNHMIFGQPLLRFPSSVQCKAVLTTEASWRVTQQIHLQRRSLFEMVLGQKMCRPKPISNKDLLERCETKSMATIPMKMCWRINNQQ